MAIRAGHDAIDSLCGGQQQTPVEQVLQLASSLPHCLLLISQLHSMMPSQLHVSLTVQLHHYEELIDSYHITLLYNFQL